MMELSVDYKLDKIFVVFAGKAFKQIIDFPMGTNCVPLLADIFLYSYKAETYTVSALNGKKQHLSSTLHIDTLTTYRPLISKL